jgi:hypothetical protein
MGEIGQQWLRELRNCDPLTFLSGLVQNVFKALTSIAVDYATYRRQSPSQAAGRIDLEWHKIKSCPYSDSVMGPDEVFFIVSSDDDDGAAAAE